MTALERAEAILRDAHPWSRSEWLRDAIHKAIVEHSNEELERRRAVEHELRVLAVAIAKRPMLAEAVRQALLADVMENGDALLGLPSG